MLFPAPPRDQQGICPALLPAVRHEQTSPAEPVPGRIDALLRVGAIYGDPGHHDKTDHVEVQHGPAPGALTCRPRCPTEHAQGTHEAHPVESLQPGSTSTRRHSLAEVEPPVTTLDSQPTPSGGIICFVTGKLVVDGDANPLMCVSSLAAALA
eukprot:scaffold27407_cov145-Isochrysis_galbana.AAC.3